MTSAILVQRSNMYFPQNKYMTFMYSYHITTLRYMYLQGNMYMYNQRSNVGLLENHYDEYTETYWFLQELLSFVWFILWLT